MIQQKKLKVYRIDDLDKISQLKSLSPQEIFDMKVVGSILPFKVNNYVLEELIDWNNIPEDPIYKLVFFNKDMISENHYKEVSDALKNQYSSDRISEIINNIRIQLNPHPSGQITKNVPFNNGETIAGIQHKYKETCLVFPSAGQTCHSYCSFCFRWPQFSNIKSLKFSTARSSQFLEYIKEHKEITDILFTGGDPMTMSAIGLNNFIDPILQPGFEHIKSIRIGTKSLSYWPYRFVTDTDSDQILRIFEKIVLSGKNLAIMAHFNHWREMSNDITRIAIRKIQNTGALIRTQSPILKYINDNPNVWINLWNEQVKMGCIPYYMFIERNTGASKYFSIPLFEAYNIFKEAYQNISGLGRTVRGPSMSATFGKVIIEGIREISGDEVFVLSYLQARVPEKCKQPFFAKYDKKATWFDDLEPAMSSEKQFFNEDLSNHVSEDIHSEQDLRLVQP